MKKVIAVGATMALVGCISLALIPAPRAAAQGILTYVTEKIGNALATHALMNGVSDGTNIRAQAGDSSGRVIAVGAAASGAAVAGAPLYVGGKDGSGNLEPVAMDTSGRVQVIGGAADAAAAAGNPVGTAGLGFNGISKAARYCDKVAAFTTQSTTSVAKQIAEVSAQNIYVCGWILHASTAITGTSLTWYSGSGASCGSGSNAAIGGPIVGTTPITDPSTPNSSYWAGQPVQLTRAAGDALCTKQASTTNATSLSGSIFYTQN